MATHDIGLKSSIWNNNIRSVLLLAFYPVILCIVAWACGAIYGALGYSDLYNVYASSSSLSEAVLTPRGDGAIATGNALIQSFWPYILGGTGIWFLIAFFFHTRMIRNMAQSKPITRNEEPELYNLLENLSITAGIQMPQLNIIDSPALNAFASGISTRSYNVTVTRGLLDRLDDDEIEAVLGHELTHILNRDVRLLIISIIFTGMLGFFAQNIWRSARYGGYRRRGGSKNDGRAIILFLGVALVLWLGYCATLFTRFALSRRREYMADAGAIELTKNPEAMMRALIKISGHDIIKEAPADIALMCIENRKKFFGLFATHPPINGRIEMISSIMDTPIPDITTKQSPSNDDPKNIWQR